MEQHDTQTLTIERTKMTTTTTTNIKTSVQGYRDTAEKQNENWRWENYFCGLNRTQKTIRKETKRNNFKLFHKTPLAHTATKFYLSLVCVLYSRFNVCHIHSLYIFVTQLLLFSKTWQICNFIIHKHSPTTLCVILIIEILILHFSFFHCFVYFFLIIFLSSFYFQHSIHLCIFIIASKSKTFGDWRVNVHVRQRQLLKIFCAVYALPCDICALCMVQHTQHTDSFECVLEWRPSAVSWYIPSLFIAFRVFDIYETCSDMKNVHTTHML